MKIYLSGGSPKKLHKVFKRYLFSYFPIKYNYHKYSAFSDFKFFIKKNNENKQKGTS